MALFPETLLSEIQSRGEAVNGSFLVSILVRDEAPIRSFRDAMENWFKQVPPAALNHFQSRLRSVKNEDFFQGFAELAFHELLLRDGLEVKQYPEGPQQPFFLLTSPGEERDFYLSVASFIPDGHPHYARRVYKNFVDELNRIRHHYRFAVYLRRWLPPDFDPTVVRRALENWFHRLDSDPHGGQYAEYRDGGVHVEFSILSRTPKVTDHLVGFNLTPLETLNTLGGFREVIEAETARHRKLGDARRPLVVVLFNNDEWQLGQNYLYDFFYGKPKMSFNWATHGGRRENVRDFSSVYAQAVFNSPQGEDLGAVLMCEKIWRESGVDLKLRCLHNPWCRRRLPDRFFNDRTALKPLAGTSPEEMVVRWTHLDDSIVHLT